MVLIKILLIEHHGIGGLAEFAIAYLTNGKGAVLESDMPFVNSEELISITELDRKVDTIVTETVTFPPLYKKYGNDGKVTYTNGGIGNDLIVYNDNEVREFRNEIKNHITNYGAITAVTSGNQRAFYSNISNPMKSKAYFCNDNSIIRDHAVTIIGWDDNYSRENFTGKAKPVNNGAYICLNTYGEESFDNGYIYISYEDSLIETYLYGIKSSSTVDYDNIYQYNPTGETTSIGTTDVKTGYIAEVFERKDNENETLNDVGIFIPSDMSLKIYVNPTGNNPSIGLCELVAQTGILAPGYHRIPIKKTNLLGKEFTIVIEQTSESNRFEFSIELAIENSLYSTIIGHPGKSLYSFDGYSWEAISDVEVLGLDMKTADMTIKAFTSKSDVIDIPEVNDEPIISTIYKIKGNDIYNVTHDTTVKNFKKNVTVMADNIEFYNESNKKLDENELITNGTTIKLTDESLYTIIVRGDTNCDGKISLVDLSKIVAHYGDENRYGLTGYILKAADMNFDEKITLTDVSQIVDLVGHL